MTATQVTPLDPLPVARDRFLGPAVLAPFADDMVRRLARLAVGPLLETVADTGVLTQAIATSVSAGAGIIATDPNPDLIEYASTKAGMARVTWRQADPCALPFEAASFGIVTCQFGMMALADRALAFHEARRVMRQGARFVFSVPAALRHNPVAECIHQALSRQFPVTPLRYLANVLHGYADNEVVDDDLTLAGFSDAMYTIVDLPFVAESAHVAAMGYCLGTPLRQEIAEDLLQDGSDPDAMLRLVESVAAAVRQRFGAGRVEAGMRAHVISAAG